MASQPHHVRQSASRGISYVAIPTTATATTVTPDDISEKTVEMDDTTPDNISPRAPGRHLRQSSTSNSGAVPSYMAPTQSAKAKLRSQGAAPKQPCSPSGPQWNSSTKRGSSYGLPGCDSSSSGTKSSATYQAPRSPNPKLTGYRRRAADGYGPEPIFMDEWMLPMVGPGPNWRHEFA